MSCNSCVATATREIHWTEFPGTPDERGASLPVCGDPMCWVDALTYVGRNGEHVETAPA